MTRLRNDRFAWLGALLALPLLVVAGLACAGQAADGGDEAAAPEAETVRAREAGAATEEPARQAGMQELILRVEGLSCPFCAFGLEKKLNEVDNIASLDIQLEAGQAVIHPEPGTSVDLAAVERAVERGGFTPRTVTLKARGRLTELDGTPVLSLPGDTLLILADDEKTKTLVSEAGGTGADKLVEVQGLVEFNHVPEGHAGHPFTLKLESFQVRAGG